MIVGEVVGKAEPIKLQLYEWYAIEAIKRKLAAAG